MQTHPGKTLHQMAHTVEPAFESARPRLLNPKSTWAKYTCGERAYYYNAETKAFSLLAPEGGVDVTVSATNAAPKIVASLTVDGTAMECVYGFGGNFSESPAAPLLVYSGGAATTEPPLADELLANTTALRGRVAVASRGGCSRIGAAVCQFVEKARRVAAAGAVALIVVNTQDEIIVPGDPAKMGSSVPVVMISQADGLRLAKSQAVTLTVKLQSTAEVEEPFTAALGTAAQMDAARVVLVPTAVDAGGGMVPVPIEGQAVQARCDFDGQRFVQVRVPSCTGAACPAISAHTDDCAAHS